MRKLVLLVLLLAGLAPAFASASVPDVPRHAVVLLYHRFGDPRYPTTNIDMPQFRAQLNYLASNGFHVWPLGRIIRHLRDGRPIPDHTVAITIDDAYRTVYENAYPLLRAHHFPFTVFVATRVVDEHGDSFMTWQQMREMARHGATFADHTVDHAHLVDRPGGESEKAWAKQVRRDVREAQRRLQAELGSRTNTGPKLFAYPYGEYDPALQRMLQKMGYVSFGQQSGAIGPGSDLEALPRFPMAGRFGTMEQFRSKIDTLPLPVTSATPDDPVVSRSQDPPVMTLALGSGLSRGERDQLSCYGSNQGRLPVTWLNRAHTRFRVRATRAFPERRARYNCTVPAGGGRYYWYSHPWIWPGRPESGG